MHGRTGWAGAWLLAVGLAPWSGAQVAPPAAEASPAPAPRPHEQARPRPAAAPREQHLAARIDEATRRGMEAIHAQDWQRALAAFNDLLAMPARGQADLALYWKAYALNGAGQRAQALEALADLRRHHAESAWLDEARVLELEIRQSAGSAPAPETLDDGELKLLALQGVLHADPDRAMPSIERLLRGPAAPGLKRRALFLLGQSGSRAAWGLLEKAVLGELALPPALRGEAVEALGLGDPPDAADTPDAPALPDRAGLLRRVYSSGDAELKRAVLRACLAAAERSLLVEVAGGRDSVELRTEALRALGALEAVAELRALYATEASTALKVEIIEALAAGQGREALLELARGERHEPLLAAAVRGLGLDEAPATGRVLLELYAGATPAVQEAVLEALHTQDNAVALVQLARTEKDPRRRARIVERLATMQSPAAADYLLQILEREP